MRTVALAIHALALTGAAAASPVVKTAYTAIPLYGTTAVAKGGAKQSLIATAMRPDGRSQITYHKWPLYTSVGGYRRHGDKQPGDIFGQGYAGMWYVVTPAGKVIYKKP
jgi:hypothetical protein